MSNKLKEYAWSSVTTFASAFAIAVAPLIGGVPLDKAALFGLFMVGVRAGIKALFQYLASGHVGELLGARGRV